MTAEDYKIDDWAMHQGKRRQTVPVTIRFPLVCKHTQLFYTLLFHHALSDHWHAWTLCGNSIGFDHTSNTLNDHHGIMGRISGHLLWLYALVYNAYVLSIAGFLYFTAPPTRLVLKICFRTHLKLSQVCHISHLKSRTTGIVELWIGYVTGSGRALFKDSVCVFIWRAL